jgi:3'(2'), 5'-bisphosphate nucleotidase
LKFNRNILRQDEFQTRLLELAQSAGKAILAIRHAADFSVDLKADNSPVTAADLAANGIIEAGLPLIFQDVSIVSEETCDLSKPAPDTFWLVDPLDGTKEFIAGNGDFTVNIALIDGGVPIYGVVDAPAKGVSYWGGPGIGAWRQSRDGRAAIAMSAPIEPIRVVASASHLNAETKAFIEALGDHVLVQAGSSIKICMLAEGAADIYPRMGPTCEWDTAAADAVLRGAGGGLFQLDGKPVVYGKREILNPHFVARAAGAR